MRPTSAVVLQQVMDDIDAAGIERLLRLARTQAVEPADILPLYIAALHQARRERDEEREKREKAQRKLDGAHEEILRLTRQCADLSRQVAHLTEMQTRAWSDKG